MNSFKASGPDLRVSKMIVLFHFVLKYFVFLFSKPRLKKPTQTIRNQNKYIFIYININNEHRIDIDIL